MDISFSNDDLQFTGPGGSLTVHPDDEISRRLAMLLAGECEGIGASEAARRFQFSRQRYYQLRSIFQHVEPRMAMHLVNESAMCLCSYRHKRTLSQKGFDLANGLPFVPTDAAIHDLLEARTVEASRHMQIALGKLRRAGKHFHSRILALDPHRMASYSKRQMRRHRFSSEEKPSKMGQSFFLLDCDTGQPVCFTLASSSPSVT